ncbi:ATP synthase F0 subcomplex B subunit [Zobellia uliginosa]|uniref:ATP synthase subunit b n=1 Tax=Zobellia uliginosa TaxID=143224 RepID=A0ABY1KS36_9FLAO|nr:F0F1 ATP synthase subunit delta [Zobellia uliginosa]SIS53502.1 ATP synthase F0 subcomplex B subunit [Zobellia uliginosa]
MKIDWFTVIAQIINFLVLMWLLKHFLYRPILASIDERETNIKKQLLEAESQKKEAAKARDEFNHKNEIFDMEKDELMRKAAIEAKNEGDRLREEARNEANELKEHLEKAFAEDQTIKNNGMAKRIKGEVLDIARKTLKDLSSASLEGQTLEVFLNKINGLRADEKVKLSKALEGGEPILVHSTFPLSKKQREAIRTTVKSLLKTEAVIEFKTRPELINGIEMLSNGYRLSWSIKDYLKPLEEAVGIES